MPEFLEVKLDKFLFKVAMDRSYSDEGVWAKVDETGIRIGLSDFLQQRNGDVAFAEVRAKGTSLAFGDEVAVIETIKADVGLSSPVAGKVLEVNPAMEAGPEAINLDPYGEGWLAMIQAEDWERDRARLLDPQAYYEVVKREAAEGAGKP